jgi:hypothetical protein
LRAVPVIEFFGIRIVDQQTFLCRSDAGYVAIPLCRGQPWYENTFFIGSNIQHGIYVRRQCSDPHIPVLSLQSGQ